MTRVCSLIFSYLLVSSYLASKSVAFSPIIVKPSKSTTTPSSQSTPLYAEQQPWDVLRFLSQSSKFVSLPFAPSGSKSSVSIAPGQVIWKPSSNKKDDLFQFAPLDDVVMGGASNSDIDNFTGLWRGTVTDANNGGFVGIRSFPASLQLDLSACNGLEWTFQTSSSNNNNTPRRLKVVLRDSADFNGIAWTACVNLKGNNKQVKVKVPLNNKSFVPTIFAKIVEDAKDEGINKSGITALQLVYSKFEFEGELNPQFEVGDFDLQLLEVKTY